ncbi:MAG: iron-containing alcohol dehydrogenase [Lentisphaeria bacterium]|nr:iron-containing alcohol dehydrogenase [Lentisphaeria bacterium]
MWENGIDIYSVRQIRTRTNLYFGVGAIEYFADIADQLAARDITSVLVVAGRGSYRRTGAWDVVERLLKERNISYVLYDKVTPNPTTVQADEAAALGHAANAQAVIAIGGGSPIDTGKSAAILLKHPGKTARELFSQGFTPAEAAPIVAINLTHGTGTEVNRFAVLTIPETEQKPVIAFDCIYPTWSIDDPALMTGLSPEQTRFVSIDAVNHVIEAATSKSTNPFAVMLGRDVIELVVRYLPYADKDPKDLNARYFLLYASMLGGISFDNGLLHYTHALEHPLSALKPELSHGLGLAVLLPAVVQAIYPQESMVLADLLKPMAPNLTGKPEEAHEAGKAVQAWLVKCGVTQKLSDVGFHREDVEKLVDMTIHEPSLSGLLEQAPGYANATSVAAIYMNSFLPLV